MRIGKLQEVVLELKVGDVMTADPITVRPEDSMSDLREVLRTNRFSGLPVVEGNKPVGILTSRDVRFEQNLNQKVAQLMTKELVTVPPGVEQGKARELLHKHRIEKLLVVGEEGEVCDQGRDHDRSVARAVGRSVAGHGGPPRAARRCRAK